MLLGKDKLLTLPKVSQSKYLHEPGILDISQTVSGVEYYGRFTMGITAVQMIGHGKYQSTPVNSISSSWSPGYRLSFLAPINDNSNLDWTVLLGLQTSTSAVNFNATQLIQHAIDPDAMEYERLTDVTFGQESLASNTIFVGLGSAYNVGNFFMKATVNGTYTKSRFEANADIQQRGHYPSLYGITIDDPSIYDFEHTAHPRPQRMTTLWGMDGRAAVGYRFPFGSSDWLNSARPMCYLSAGVRHHSKLVGRRPSMGRRNQALQGALNAFGSNNFQTYFIEIAFDLRRRTPQQPANSWHNTHIHATRRSAMVESFPNHAPTLRSARHAARATFQGNHPAGECFYYSGRCPPRCWRMVLGILAGWGPTPLNRKKDVRLLLCALESWKMWLPIGCRFCRQLPTRHPLLDQGWC